MAKRNEQLLYRVLACIRKDRDISFQTHSNCFDNVPQLFSEILPSALS